MKTFTIKMERNGKIFITKQTGFTLTQARRKAEKKWGNLAEVVR